MSFKSIYDEKRKVWFFIVVILAITISLYSYNYFKKSILSSDIVIANTIKKLDKIDVKSSKIANEISRQIKSNKNIDWNSFYHKYPSMSADIFVYKNDSLIFWNSNSISLDNLNSVDFKKNNTGLTQIKHHWFFLRKYRDTLTKVFVIFPISPSVWFYQGNYQFVSDSKYLKKISKNIFPLPRKYNIFIKRVSDNIFSNEEESILAIFFFILYFLILEFLYILYKKIKTKIFSSYLIYFFFVLNILLLRLFDLYFHFPNFIKIIPLFNDTLSTNLFLNSTGNLILNLFVLYFMVRGLSLIKFRNKWNLVKSLVLFFLEVFLLILPFALLKTLDIYLYFNGFSLLNSDIGVNSNDVFTLIIILLIALIIYKNVFEVFNIEKQFKIKIFDKIRFVVLFFIALFILLFSFLEKEIIFVGFFLILGFGVFRLILNKLHLTSVLYFLSIALIISFIGAYMINLTDLERKQNSQIFTANYLKQKNDPFFEYTVESRISLLRKDSSIVKIIEDTILINKEQTIEKLLQNTYFKDFRNEYKIQVTLCYPGQLLEIQPQKMLVRCAQYFDSLKGKTVVKGNGYNFRLINHEYESIYYVLTIEPSSNMADKPLIIIEFLTERVPTGIGYTELLDNNRYRDIHLEQFSFARYKRKILQYKFGNFLYPMDLDEFSVKSKNKFFHWNGFIHYILPLSKNEYLIVSREEKPFSYILFPFTLIFSIILLLYFIYFGVRFISNSSRKISFLNYSSRIQLIYFISFIIVFAVLSFLSIYYVNYISKNAVESELEEKTHSIYTELQHKFSTECNLFSVNHIKLKNYLKKLSSIFFTDINLYDNGGRLISTSRPEIFNQQLQSKLMNPVAYESVKFHHKLFFLNLEKIDHHIFYSSYLPLVLENGLQAGYVNLPYFARESRLIKSKYLLMISFLNLLIIIGIIIFLISYFVTLQITKPLFVLKQKFESTKMGDDIEKIAWKRNDEIGQLIEAYNNMVDKLRKSTELLKKTERESAWREMASQISHEIRNPLTPMKLNIQYLIKARNENDPEFDSKLKSISQSLITQIDTLNEVAALFSDFSKKKSLQSGTANLVKVINSAISLFSNRDDVLFKFLYERQDSFQVHGNENDLIRIFNNLIKNSLQSFGDKGGGQVSIEMKQIEDKIFLSFSDNGTGISKDDRHKIFQPYFTTKTKGTGLGLAIVYNLMNELGGKIILNSNVGKGTVFHLWFQSIG